jgi:hypothetical protein
MEIHQFAGKNANPMDGDDPKQSNTSNEAVETRGGSNDQPFLLLLTTAKAQNVYAEGAALHNLALE